MLSATLLRSHTTHKVGTIVQRLQSDEFVILTAKGQSLVLIKEACLRYIHAY